MSDITDDIKSLVAEMPDAPTPDMVIEFPKVTRLPVEWNEPHPDAEVIQKAFRAMDTGNTFVVLTTAQAIRINDLLGNLVSGADKPSPEEALNARGAFLPDALTLNMESLVKSLRHNFAIEQQKYPNP